MDDLKSPRAWDSTSTLAVPPTTKPLRAGKDFAKAFGELQASQGLGGAPIIVPTSAKKSYGGIATLLKRVCKSTTPSHSSPTPASGNKDFAEAFGALQTSYGTSGAPIIFKGDHIK
jgi:hypothetical protein